MTIDAGSTVADIYLVTPVTPTSDDLAAWTALTLPTEAALVQSTGFNTGLFGYDLTNFFAYCETTDICNSEDYNSKYFDGWALGGNITIDDYTDVN